ncbi:PE-PPE domain-containing protein [Mycobacteroides abscessus]|uniref:PE-PPE domain-containing protein n=1 Tax=Mycobacteroides abscessus TaxID=36809 RepID=UPI00092A3CE5|nr:PE-PPE domain-containing protein [Mycobacteroides abscessus]SIC47750.1 PE/PPE family protein [Mycobacteroides abscessus subsp. abscessus]
MAVQHSVSGKRRSFRRSVATAAAVAATCTVLAPVAMESKTIASTLTAYVLGVGGNNDGASLNVPDKIGGAYSVNYNPVAYPGAIWPVSGIAAPTFKQSVTEGNTNLNEAIAGAPENEHVVVVGYSLGAVVANRSYRDLAQSDPDADVEFVFLGSANTPNGGIFARFPWLFVPFADIESDGALPEGPFKTTVINTEYDVYGDFPAYFNPLALANSIAAIQYAHPDKYYDEIDPATLDDPNNPNVIKTVDGNRTYYLVRAEHLPLLQPLRDLTNPIGASFVLDAIEPTLRVFIDMAYDRETSPGTVKTFSLFTPPKNIIDALNKLPGAIQEGAENFQNGLPGAAPKQPAPVEKPANAPAPEADPAKSSPPAAQTPAPQAAKEPVLTLTTPEPATPPASTKLPDPAAIAVSASVPDKAEPATPDVAAPAPATETKPDESKPDEKPTLTSVKDTVKPKNTTKPTLRLPKLPASQPGTTPKTPKFPSLKDHLKSIPGLGVKKDATKATTPDATSKPAESTHESTGSSTSSSEKHSDAA